MPTESTALSDAQHLEILRGVTAIAAESAGVSGLFADLAGYLGQLFDTARIEVAILDEEGWRGAEVAVLSGRETGSWSRFAAGPVDGWAIRSGGTLQGAFLVWGAPQTPLYEAQMRAFVAYTTPHLTCARAKLAFDASEAELAAIYAIDALRDAHLDFETMLSRVLGETASRMPARRVAIGLADAHGGPLELRWSSAPSDVEYDTARLMVRRAARSRDGLRTTDCMTAPLVVEGSAQIGALVAFSEGPDSGFDLCARRVLRAIGSQLDTAIFEDLSKKRIEQVFRRYVSDAVVEEMLRDGGDHYLKGQRREVTVLFSDLRGFTALSEQLEVDVLVKMLNEHLAAMTEVVFRHEGTVDKFIGDCVMAFFGAPTDQPDHAELAARTALAMQRAHEALRVRWKEAGLPAPHLGIGINSGEVMVGNIGSARLSSYTVIGDNVNLAARLEGLALGGQVLVTVGTRDRLGASFQCKPNGVTTVKGKSTPSQLWLVEGEQIPT